MRELYVHNAKFGRPSQDDSWFAICRIISLKGAQI